MSEIPLCEIRSVEKSFPGVKALQGVDLRLARGEVHAVVGENGAGKSTLIKILAGILAPDAGEIFLEGAPVQCKGPREALGWGIAAAHQDPELFQWRSAAENCFNQAGLPGSPFISWSRVERESRAALGLLGATFPPQVEAARLSASERQLVALAGALLARPRLLILDEPTASLSGNDAERLFGIIRDLRAGGTGILYVSHRLPEVLRLADRVTVLRDGLVVRSAAAAEIDAEGLIEAMVGRKLSSYYPRPPDPGAAPLLLDARGLSDLEGSFQGVDLALRRGEVLGIYGLLGAGRTELGRALAGSRPTSGGSLRLDGTIAYLPEDRSREGNLPGLSLGENLSISWLARAGAGFLVSAKRERELVRSLAERLEIRSAGTERAIETLSGGNQQKALLGRFLAGEPDVLVLDEPTQGIDVGAKAEIHQLIAALARAGRGIILISSDLSEVRGMSHRLMVLREGRVSHVFEAASASEEAVGRAALPLDPRAAAVTAPAGTGVGKAPGVRRGERRPPSWRGRREFALALAVLAVFLVTGLHSSAFLSASSVRDIAANSAGLALAALGEMLVLATGAIDISIGSALALCAAAAALHASHGGGPAPAVILAVLLGIGLGTVNAVVSAAGRLHPIITTLGTLAVFRGAFLLWTGGDWLNLPEPLLSLASGGPLGVPASVWGTGIAFLAAAAFLRWTRVARACLKVGDNPRAARTHGLRSGLARWAAFAFLGAATGLAAVFYTARFGKVQSNTGVGFELQAIAAAVLGGTHVGGGRGTVLGALLGAALIGVLSDARAVWGVHERWQLVIVGALMLGALALEGCLSRAFRGGAR